MYRLYKGVTEFMDEWRCCINPKYRLPCAKHKPNLKIRHEGVIVENSIKTK